MNLDTGTAVARSTVWIQSHSNAEFIGVVIRVLQIARSEAHTVHRYFQRNMSTQQGFFASGANGIAGICEMLTLHVNKGRYTADVCTIQQGSRHSLNTKRTCHGPKVDKPAAVWSSDCEHDCPTIMRAA